MNDLLGILSLGAEAWNGWRTANPDNHPRFSDVLSLQRENLRGYDFRATDFHRVNLQDADLRDCDFRGAHFHECALQGAKLAGAHVAAFFSKTRLDGLDFTASIIGEAAFNESYLSQADFSGCDLTRADFSDAECYRTDFTRADLTKVSMQRANCNQAKFRSAKLIETDLTGAILHMADLDDADLTGAALLTAQLILASAQRANFTGADLGMASVVNSNLSGATLVGTIYGLAAWNVELEGATQDGLVITRGGEAVITCDDLEIAQFIHLLLENAKVRKVIDTVTSKVVLILGRFTEERKAVLDALRDALRQLDKTPILFDFDKPSSKDVLGTVETLARMARFIVADITDPSSVPLELAYVVRDLPNTPVLPLLLEGATEFSMFADLRRRHSWVMETQRYRDQASLLAALPALIAPADGLAAQLRGVT